MHPPTDELTLTHGDVKHQTDAVVTRQDFPAPPAAVWGALMFYEEIAERPSFLLRLLLPVPLGTEGRKSDVGGEVKCRYRSGDLLKRVTQITPERHYAFDVVEQDLALGRGIKLLGGDYTLREVSKGRTRVALTTRYASPHQPRWFCKWIEAMICHLFHRHILRALRNNLQLGELASSRP